MPETAHASAHLKAFVDLLVAPAEGGSDERAVALRALIQQLSQSEAREIAARVKNGGPWRQLLERQLAPSTVREVLEKLSWRVTGTVAVGSLLITPEQRGIANRGTMNRGTANRGTFSQTLGASASGGAVGATIGADGHIQLPPVQTFPSPPPARLEETSAQQRGGLVVLHFFDLAGTFDNEVQLREDVRKNVVKSLELFKGEVDSDGRKEVKVMGLRFQTTFQKGEPSLARKRAMLPLDFPFYVIDPPSGRGSKDAQMKLIWRLMHEHQIPKVLEGTHWYDEMKRAYFTSDAGGLGTETTHAGTKKIAFLLSSALTFATMQAWGVANDVLHEFGHNNNVPFRPHPKDASLMSNKPQSRFFNIDRVRYNPSNTKTVMDNLFRLWQAQQHM